MLTDNNSIKSPMMNTGSKPSHPELREGEMFWSNFSNDKRAVVEAKIQNGEPLRIGDVAYDANNRPFQGAFPVFKRVS